MSIASAISAAQGRVANAYTACNNKGATMPATQNLANLPDTIDSIPSGGETWRKWTRPSEWPQYTDSMLNEEVVYLTYDCRVNKEGSHRGFMCVQIKGAYTVERGSVSNGVFTAVTTNSVASGVTFFEVLPTNEGDYVVYRIKPQSGSHITKFDFYQKAQTGYSTTMPATIQPCVERFANMPYFENIIFGGWGVKYSMVSDTVKGLSAVTSFNSFYNGYIKLEHCVLAGTLTACTQTAYMFQGCSALYDLDLSKLNISNALTRCESTFTGCTVLEKIGIGTWNMSSVTRVDAMFRNCYALREIKGVASWRLASATTTNYMFGSCGALMSLDSSEWTSSSSLTDMSYMFSDCDSITELDLGKMTVSGVTNFCSTFYNCRSLVSVNLSSWAMTAATRIDAMFRHDFNLTTITFGANGMRTSSSLTNCSYTFGECYSLRGVDVSGMVTSGVTDFTYMFNKCNSLEEIDISNFSFAGIATTAKSNSVFYECLVLTSITLPSANMTYLSDSMFRYCRYIENIVFPGSITAIATYVFADCASTLVFDFRAAQAVPSLANTNAFSGNTNSVIVVPDALYSQWIAATNWSSLSSRIVKASDYTD